MHRLFIAKYLVLHIAAKTNISILVKLGNVYDPINFEVLPFYIHIE